MKVFHIVGAQCAGKTHTITALRDMVAMESAKFDILDDFYIPNQVVDQDGKMDWDKWHNTIGNLHSTLDTFFEENKDKIIFLESTGMNKAMNEYLENTGHITLHLETPDNKTLLKRAKERNISEETLTRNVDFSKRNAGLLPSSLSVEKIALAVRSHLGPVKVSIIGTAGRKDDKAKMSKAVYANMFRATLRELRRLSLDLNNVELISGGAAWADHIAVSLFLAKKAPNLTLHMPAEMTKDFSRFMSTKDGRTANYYHDYFSEQMGKSTLKGIGRAISEGAKVVVSEGFKQRNLKVADTDAIIALTWGVGSKPKDGGTKHTWDNSKAKVKVHIPIGMLGD